MNACILECSKAFDKCLFDKLFGKLIAKGLPAVVIRVLVFMYEEQQGWVKLGGKRSSLLPAHRWHQTRISAISSAVLSLRR